MVEPIFIILSAIAGFLISFYFSGVYYGFLKSNTWWIPAVCRMNKNTCEKIIETPEASVFGLPNFVLGMIFYVIIIVTIVGDVQGFLFDIALAIALFTVLLAVYLIYALWFVVRMHCPLCYIAHGLNTVIAILFVSLRYDIF
jgi:uncharacterized membrane protein